MPPRPALALVAAGLCAAACGGPSDPILLEPQDGVGLRDGAEPDGAPTDVAGGDSLDSGDADDAFVGPDAPCQVGDRFCVTVDSALACPDGHGYHLVECATGTGCHEATGQCRILLCEPGVLACVGPATYRECLPSGTGWQVGVSQCEAGFVCHDGTCSLCQPGKPFCLAPDATGQCNEEGDGYSNPQVCLPGYLCNETHGECREPICKPFSVKCKSAFTFAYCLPSGTGWTSESYACTSDELCIDGSCLLEPCVPSALLLVDASGSMESKWAAVKETVHELVATHPNTLFGLGFFPTNASCGTTDFPQIPIGLYTADDLAAFFDSRGPVGGTPLVEAMVDLLLGAAPTFGNYGGALVLLSDGEDSCGPQTAANEDLAVLASATQALLDQYRVRTYVIGYGYEGDKSDLVTIAANGGTELSTFVAADDVSALADAFGAIMGDLKTCSAQNGE